jgi:O-acetyl-ADP-ribose deacetylase (regulator of RNase III)
MATLEFKKGDLLEAEEPLIVHGCNARGSMGAGVAALIRQKWPRAYDVYRSHHEAHGLTVGDVIFVEVAEGKVIANAITQQDYGRNKNRRYVSYDAVADCMKKVAAFAKDKGIMQVAMPRIGAGLANGDWAILACIIERALPTQGIAVTVYDL